MGLHLALTPLYARVPKGVRAEGSVPRNDGKNMTLIASLSVAGMGEALLLEGAADARAFEQILASQFTGGANGRHGQCEDASRSARSSGN